MRRLILPALMLAMSVAACGGAPADTGVASAGGGTAQPSSSPSATVDSDAAALKFAQCMRENGVQMEDPKNGRIMMKGGPGDREKMEKAQKACQHHMEGAVGDRGQGIPAEERDRMLKFAQCMREHGIPMKDPSADGRIEINVPRGTDPKKVDEAQAACKEFGPEGQGS
ncbi:hypothetical protein ACIBH1_44020 [Nonomuraea sp. NPDC050663]|uniref:hypothetical protein n=1 Tax=Nonomuraea sp. NPDC050663 TaxID=3364370 RepID=UPI00378FECBF